MKLRDNTTRLPCTRDRKVGTTVVMVDQLTTALHVLSIQI